MAKRRTNTATMKLQLQPPPVSIEEEKRTAYAAELVIAVTQLRLTIQELGTAAFAVLGYDWKPGKDVGNWTPIDPRGT